MKLQRNRLFEYLCVGHWVLFYIELKSEQKVILCSDFYDSLLLLLCVYVLRYKHESNNEGHAYVSRKNTAYFGKEQNY